MTRGKILLKRIPKKSARMISFNKRKNGLVKKVKELSTLCNAEMCLVIVSPFDGKPTVWPSASGVETVVQRYKNMPEWEKTKHQFDMETFSRKRVEKLKRQLKKQELENKEDEINLKINEILKGESSLADYLQDIDDIQSVIGRKLKELDMRIKSLRPETPEMMRNYGMHVGESSNNNMEVPLEAQHAFSCWNDNPISPFPSFPENTVYHYDTPEADI